MTTSKYFHHQTFKAEQDLMQDLTVEVIKQRGIDMIYIPRELTDDIDFLFGEDPTNKFTKGVVIEMYPGNLNGFEGEGDFMAGFGLDVRDEASFEIAKSRFAEEVIKRYPAIIRPREGDVIVFALSSAAFEITFVEHEKPFYQAGKIQRYKVSCKRYEWSHEEFQDAGDLISTIPTYVDPSDNETIVEEGEEIVDFSEKDPFSENMV